MKGCTVTDGLAPYIMEGLNVTPPASYQKSTDLMGTIAVIDYGLGNLRSVSGAIARVGHEAVVTDDPAVLDAADALVLPGVGAFGDGMRKLHQRGLVEPLDELVLGEQRPILGICLGAQLMARSSTEFGDHAGLGWIDASVEMLAVEDLPLPHVGWNDVTLTRSSLLFSGIESEALVYFVHTYHIVCNEPSLVTSSCHYGHDFVASFEKDNIHGAQFHPEKSQSCGLKILENFVGLLG